MLRRLFFLFPDEAHAQRVVEELINNDIPEHRIHAIARGIELNTLPEATERQKRDTAFRLEKILWNANLSIFALSFVMLFATLIAGEFLWAVAAVAVMLASFIAGEWFVVYLPDVHLSEFTDALSHGEILLMIDVPKKRVDEIERFVHHHHLEAFVGGVSWSVDAFGL